MANVTVVGEVPTCSVASVPTSSVFTGGDPNVLYLGYGAQSTVLNSTVSGGSNFTYSWSGTGLSCTTCANPTFTPTSGGTYSFTLTVTNEFGCTTTCEVSVCVWDIRVRKNNGQIKPNKVYLCHVPNGNNSNPQTLSISTNAVASHLSNHGGDALGTCGQTCGSAGSTAKTGELHSSTFNGLDIDVILFPNPTNGQFTVELESESDLPVAVTVYNVAGVVMEQVVGQSAHSPITMGQGLSNGMYIVHVTQGDFTKILRVTRTR